MQENFESIEGSSAHGRTPSTQLPSSGYPLHNSPRLQHSVAVDAPQRTIYNRPDVKLGENIYNTTRASSHGRTLTTAEYTLPSSPRIQQNVGVDTEQNVLYTHSDRMAEETLNNTASSSSRGHSLVFLPHRSPSPSPGHALCSSPRFSEMHQRTDTDLLQMPENYPFDTPTMSSFAYGRTLGPSSTQVSLLCSENNLHKCPPLFMVRQRAGTDSPEQTGYSESNLMTEQNFNTIPSSSHAVPPPQQPLPPASAQNLLPNQMDSKTSGNSEWRDLSETTQNENSRYYNPQLNKPENKNKGQANKIDQHQQSGGRGFENFQSRRIRMSSVSQRFNAENGGVRSICKNNSVAPLLSGLGETLTSFASQGICSLQARQVPCDKQTTENYCEHPSHNAKIVEEIPTEHYEKRLQRLCNCRSLDDGLAQIARLLNGIYLTRLQDIDNNGQCDKDLITFQEWLDILLKINHSVLTNMEELESEMAKCLECARCKVKPGYRLNQSGELLKCRQDIKSLIKIVQNAYHHNNWNFDGISLATVSLSQILGASVPNDENLRADGGAAQMQKKKLSIPGKEINFKLQTSEEGEAQGTLSKFLNQKCLDNYFQVGHLAANVFQGFYFLQTISTNIVIPTGRFIFITQSGSNCVDRYRHGSQPWQHKPVLNLHLGLSNEEDSGVIVIRKCRIIFLAPLCMLSCGYLAETVFQGHVRCPLFFGYHHSNESSVRANNKSPVKAITSGKNISDALRFTTEQFAQHRAPLSKLSKNVCLICDIGLRYERRMLHTLAANFACL
uniref:Uncharacterized protein n=1 Tax=Glossina pallidipes TaxID=7398 RepID=A0A1B0AGS0_GLOPL